MLALLSSFFLLLALVPIDLLFGEVSLDVVDQVAVNKRTEPRFSSGGQIQLTSSTTLFNDSVALIHILIILIHLPELLDGASVILQNGI